MKYIEFTGKSINEAVDKAHDELSLDYNDLHWEVIDEPSKGFLGIVGAKPARIRVEIEEEEDKKPVEKPSAKPEKREKHEKHEYKKESRRTEKKYEKPEPKAEKPEKLETKPEIKAETAPVEEPKPSENTMSQESEEIQSARANLTEEDKTVIINSALDFLKAIFSQMGMDVKLSVTFDDNKHLFINMEGEDMGTIIGKRGQTLDSLQYLTNLVVNKGEYPYMNVTLDTEDYRAKRKKTLEALAFNLAKKAKHNRRNVTLEPMNPYERRIIHATLQNDRYVTTYSEGVEPYRYVVIALKSNYNKRNNY